MYLLQWQNQTWVRSLVLLGISEPDYCLPGTPFPGSDTELIRSQVRQLRRTCYTCSRLVDTTCVYMYKITNICTLNQTQYYLSNIPEKEFCNKLWLGTNIRWPKIYFWSLTTPIEHHLTHSNVIWCHFYGTYFCSAPTPAYWRTIAHTNLSRYL